jgi:hypothetical protein
LVLGLVTLPARAQDAAKDGGAKNGGDKDGGAKDGGDKDGGDPKEVMQKVLQKAEDDYRLYFRKPQTTAEYWAAINFEIDVGKLDVAGLLLDELVKKEPKDAVDKDLAKIQETKGLAPFLRLQTVRRWFDNPALEREAEHNVEVLINRVTAAVERTLAAPERITRFIKALQSPIAEERAYAFAQLQRSRERATPYLVDALRQTAGTPEHDRLLDAMERLGPTILRPAFAILAARGKGDEKEMDLRLDLLSLIRKADDTRAVPFLWYPSASPKIPAVVRDQAKRTLASLLRARVASLPPARLALTQLADEYYRHQVRFTNPRKISAWSWDGKELSRKPVVLTGPQAEQYFGLLFAGQALDLDPAYEPAQELFLSLTLQENFADKLDQTRKPLPGSLQRLLSGVSANLLLDTLERALADRNLAVILPLVRILGERGEPRAAQPTREGPPHGLPRALYYPDRRVQLAAAEAILKMPTPPEPAVSARVVEVLRRFVAAEAAPRALAVFVPGDRAAAVRKGLKDAGYEPELVSHAQDALVQLDGSADFDLVLIHPAGLPAEMPFLIAQIRGDPNVGLLPILLLSTQDQKEKLDRLARQHTNVTVVPEALLTVPEEFKARVQEATKLALVPAGIARLPDSQRAWVEAEILKGPLQTLSAQERKEFAAEALDILAKMARGDISGYDIRPAQGTAVDALANPDLAPGAFEILGRLGGSVPQQKLAAVVLDPGRGKLRLPAAVELNRSVTRNGLLLGPTQLADVKAAVDNAKEDAGLRAELALVLSHREPGSQLTGARLRSYTPEAPPPPPPPPAPLPKKQ